MMAMESYAASTHLLPLSCHALPGSVGLRVIPSWHWRETEQVVTSRAGLGTSEPAATCDAVSEVIQRVVASREWNEERSMSMFRRESMHCEKWLGVLSILLAVVLLAPTTGAAEADLCGALQSSDVAKALGPDWRLVSAAPLGGAQTCYGTFRSGAKQRMFGITVHPAGGEPMMGSCNFSKVQSQSPESAIKRCSAHREAQPRWL